MFVTAAGLLALRHCGIGYAKMVSRGLYQEDSSQIQFLPVLLWLSLDQLGQTFVFSLFSSVLLVQHKEHHWCLQNDFDIPIELKLPHSDKQTYRQRRNDHLREDRRHR